MPQHPLVSIQKPPTSSTDKSNPLTNWPDNKQPVEPVHAFSEFMYQI